MWSGDHPGLQNRRAAGLPVTGGFDPHSLPPFFNLQTTQITCKSVRLRQGHLYHVGMGFLHHVCDHSPASRTRSWWCGCPRDASVFVVLPLSSRRHPATSDRYAVSPEPADGSGCGSASERTPNSIVGPRLAAEPPRRSKHPAFITRELHCLLPGTARASPALPYRPRPSDCSSMSKANIP